MARITNSNSRSSSSNSYERNYYQAEPNVSTTLRPGPAGSIGVPEVSSGIPSPPLSPPLAAHNNTSTAKHAASDISSRAGGRTRRGGAAYTITGECERLFCETLKAVFLGEGNLACQDSLVMGMHNNNTDINANIDIKNDYGVEVATYFTNKHGLPSPEADGFHDKRGLVTQWIEIWDYVGGARFRGFVTEKNGEKAMFVFFDRDVVGNDLKPGLMALLELCEHPYFTCSRLIVCLDRFADPQATATLTKDLGWIGFGLTTLADWNSTEEITSTRWLFMSMDV